MFYTPGQWAVKQIGGVSKLARLIGITKGAVSKWQNGKMKISTETQEKILKVAKDQGLDVTPYDLIYGRKENLKKKK